MTQMSWATRCAFAFSGVLASTLATPAQVNPDLYAGLKWRNVGLFHGGRIASVTGVIGDSGTFYFGSPLGGTSPFQLAE
jgi:hypothetical protein